MLVNVATAVGDGKDGLAPRVGVGVLITNVAGSTALLPGKDLDEVVGPLDGNYVNG